MIKKKKGAKSLTEMVSHDESPIPLSLASSAMAPYMERMAFGAGTVSGRAKGALMRALSGPESFDMISTLLGVFF